MGGMEAVAKTWRACLVLAVLSFASAHNRAHDPEVSRHQAQLVELLEGSTREAHRSLNPHLSGEGAARRRAAEVEPQTLRIKPVYQLDGLDSAKAEFLQNELIPAALDALHRLIKVKQPVEGNLLLPRLCSMYYVDNSGQQITDRCVVPAPMGTCGPYASHDPNFFGSYFSCPYSWNDCTNVQGGNGVSGADYVLYVTAQNMGACYSGTVATGGFCSLDLETDRPLAGFANFCPNSLDPSENFGYQLDTAVHEIIHGVAMSEYLFSYYKDADGKPYVLSPSIPTTAGMSVITTPMVRSVVREHFDCPSALGAPLEDGGGEGTSSSHWESRYFDSEVMQGSSNLSSRQLLSKLTLALMADSGWYVPDLASAPELAYGYHKGCSFLIESCAQSQLPDLFDGYFCPAEAGSVFVQASQITSQATDTCSWDYRSIAYCSVASELTGTCKPVVSYSNGVCSDEENANSRLTSYDFGSAWGLTTSRCLPIASDKIKVDSGTMTYTIDNPGSSCWNMKCGNSGQSVIVTLKGKEVSCPAGGYINLASLSIGVQEGVIGPCPPPHDICPFIGCPDNCGGQGQCLNGQCQCYVGWTGPTCTLPVCGAAGGDSFCQAVQGSDTSCNLDAGVCVCSAGGTGCGLPELSSSPSSEEPTGGVLAPDPTAPSSAPSVLGPMPTTPSGTSSPSTSEEPASGQPEVAYILGKAFTGAGYLQDCTIYLSISGSDVREITDPHVQTDSHGGFYTSTAVSVPLAVELPGGGACRGSFTGIAPTMVLEAAPGSQVLNPASTMVARLMASSDGSLGLPDAQQTVSALLGLPPSSRVYSEDIIQIIAAGGLFYANNEAAEESAMVTLSSIASGVAVASAWLSARSDALTIRLAASDSVTEALEELLSEGYPVSFESPANISVVLQRAAARLGGDAVGRASAADGANLEQVAASVANIAALGGQLQADYNEIDFLAQMAALARVVHGNIALQASLLALGFHGAAEYAVETSAEKLASQVEVAMLSGPSIYEAIDVEAPAPPPVSGGLPLPKGVTDFWEQVKGAWAYSTENSWIAALVVGALVLSVLLCFASIFYKCCGRGDKRRERPPSELDAHQLAVIADHTGRGAQHSASSVDLDMLDAARLAQALELSLQEPYMPRPMSAQTRYLYVSQQNQHVGQPSAPAM